MSRCVGVLLIFLSVPCFAQRIEVDPKLPAYKPVAGVSGSLKSVGSDTMNNLMTYWSEGFRKFYPNVRPEIEGKGSSTAPPALIARTATFGPMSRDLKPDEIDTFEKKFGFKPVQLGTSIDLLAIYVNKDNPLKSLTVKQSDAIFSTTRKHGAPAEIRTWGQLELTGPYANAPISLYGRNSASGTYGFFKQVILGEGDFKNSVKEQPGSSSVVQAVASDKFGIGYSGIGYKTADVRAVPLAGEGEPIEPSAENVYTGEYPLARYLWLTLEYAPKSKLDPLRREFIKYVFSKQGQEDVVKDGYFPVNADLALQELAKVGL